MGLGHDNTPAPARQFNARVNQSVYGYPAIVAMGTAQVQQQIVWIDGFSSTAAPTASGKGGGGGGGKGGGKGTTASEFIYSADVVAVIGCGPIQGVGDVWSGQSWLGSPNVAESYTISSASDYQYTPANASAFYNNQGVGMAAAYSSSHNDIGAPAPTVLSGVHLVSMLRRGYGDTLTSGQYSINPSTNAYSFSSADAGQVVTLYYSYLVEYLLQQERDTIPAGQTLSVGDEGGGAYVHSDQGVVYAGGVNEGTAFQRVGSSPSTGQYSISGNNPLVYHFAAGDVGSLVTLTWQEFNPNVVSPGQATSLNYTLNNGARGQSPFSFLSYRFPGAAYGYTGLATILYQPMDLGLGAQIQENRFEVITDDIFGNGVLDCNPVQCLGRVLTDTTWGLGAGPVPFPVSCIDNGVNGTWGGDVAAGQQSVAPTAWNWCAANSMFISPVIDGQNTAASEMSKWLEASMLGATYSEGLLKLFSFGDTSCAGNGCTWTAPTEYVVELDDTCFSKVAPDKDPVKISRASTFDAWNVVQIQWDNRSNQYAPEITQESDQSLINRWGERREDPQNHDFIHTVAAATFDANMRIKHGSYIRNTYEFGLPYTYGYIEPGDIIEISTTSLWMQGFNNLNLEVTGLPVRVMKVVDDPVKGLQVTCEDYPWGAHQPTIYNKQLNTSEVPANAYVDPGNTVAVIFEAPDLFAQSFGGVSGDMVVIGAMGTSKSWGCCNVWVAEAPGGPYLQKGTIYGASRLGAVAVDWNAHSSPDTVDTLYVDLAENCLPWEAGTSEDADSGNTLVFVDGEIIAYSALTYNDGNQIQMDTYIDRGLYGTTIAEHFVGSLVMRLDSAVFKFVYDPAWRGTTLYFKFQSVNEFGLKAQDLSTITPLEFLLPGTNQGSVDAETGLVIDGALGTNVSYRPTSNPLSAVDAGSNATIDIASFALQLPGKTVSYNSGSITTLNYSTLYYIYFDDSTLAGGSVTYHTSTTKETAIVGTTRYFVGSIFTPISGGNEAFGNNDGGSGAQVGMLNTLSLSLLENPPQGSPSTFGSGTITNPEFAIDGDPTTFAAMAVTGDGANSYAQLWIGGPPGLTRAYQSVTIYATLSIPVNNLTTSNPAPDPSVAVVLAIFLQTYQNGVAASGVAISFINVTYNSGTLAKATYSYTLPAASTFNFSQSVFWFNVFGYYQTVPPPVVYPYTGGTLQMNIYEVYIEALE